MWGQKSWTLSSLGWGFCYTTVLNQAIYADKLAHQNYALWQGLKMVYYVRYLVLTKDEEIVSVFHLPKNSRNSGWDINGTWVFGSFHWKCSEINGIPEKVVPFSRWKLLSGKFVFHLQISCLYHQFHAFHSVLSGQASLGSLVFQQKWWLIRVSFLEALCKQTFRATTSALPATLVFQMNAVVALFL